MKHEDKIIQRLKSLVVDLLQLEQDSVEAGISPVEILGIEDAGTMLRQLAGRLTGAAR